jgi:serine/threonine protein phosphatase 1
MGKIFAIGDIHGCYDKLCILMGKIDVDFERDTLVFLGDYIDRGPDSFKVVEYLIDLKKRFPEIIFLKGNHEEMLENYLSGADRLSYLANGGRETLESYLKQSRIPDTFPIPHEHLAFFESLVLFFQTDNYIFVHAGLRDKIPLEEQKSDDLLWIRDKFIRSTYDFGKRVVFGHTPLSEPLVQPNKIGIDTGAVYGNKLTCVQLPDLEFHHA